MTPAAQTAERERDAERKSLVRALAVNAAFLALLAPGSLAAANNTSRSWALLAICAAWALGCASQARRIIAAPNMGTRGRRLAATAALLAGLAPAWVIAAGPRLSR